MVPSSAEYVNEGAVLKITGKLDFDEEDVLREKGLELISGGESEVLIDLSDVTYVASSCLGGLLVLDEEAKKKDVKLKVRIPRALLYVYDLMGVRNVVETEIID